MYYPVHSYMSRLSRLPNAGLLSKNYFEIAILNFQIAPVGQQLKVSTQ